MEYVKKTKHRNIKTCTSNAQMLSLKNAKMPNAERVMNFLESSW